MNTDGPVKSTSPFRKKKTSRASSPRQGPVTAAPPLEWGPAFDQTPQIGSGSQIDRGFLIREAKRKAMMSANGGLEYTSRDSMGRHKRRTSDDIDAAMIPAEDMDGDALVYIHKVRLGDTLAGLTIKYNCQLSVLRKANRMWPNDPIQSRKTIMLPVDACGVKGKVVPGPTEPLIPEEDLLGSMDADPVLMHESPDPSNPSSNGWTSGPSSSLSPPFRPTSPTLSSSKTDEPTWKHDSWVLLPNDIMPTEIVRLPRQSLGYFPRARRKSLTQSEAFSSRHTSLDISRSSVPTRTASPPGGLSPQRRSRSSTAALMSSRLHRRNRLEDYLSGPGGVGPLTRDTRAPGPGPDMLAEFLAPSLKDYAAPPKYQTVYTPWAPSFLDEGSGTAPDSMDGTAVAISNGGSGLGDVGHSIETFVRKVAQKAATALEGTNGMSSSGQSGLSRAGGSNPGVQGLGLAGGMGDLIELVDAFEVSDSRLPGSDAETVRVDGAFGSTGGAWYDQQGSGMEIRGRKRK
jgi:hypothetical protein